ncbi:MAG: phosphate ABC transporter permease subunit PstC [Verrucomicrobiota bacterium]
MQNVQNNEALAAALRGKTRVRVLGLTFDDVVRYFFAGNATVAVIVLVLILVFLTKEGIGFFGQNQTNLSVYRKAGLEYVDLIRQPIEEFSSLTRSLNEIRVLRFKALTATGKDPAEANEALAAFDAFSSKLSGAPGDARGLVSDLTEAASAIKTRAQVNADREEQKAMLLHAGKKDEAQAVTVEVIDFGKEVQALTGTLPAWKEAAQDFQQKLGALVTSARSEEWAKADVSIQKLLVRVEKFSKELSSIEGNLAAWRWDKPVRFHESVTAFLFGREWITASFWQDWYGMLPLLSGSLLVSFIAILIAVPLAISAAIYVSEVATPGEKALIKPYIEFISAIPSVVLGFFGIAILGTVLRSVSEVSWLNWIPGFPMPERLNAFTAGCLLALTSIPTIFSLAEDAITNVPKHFKEASFALGATRLQTLIRVLIPASLSGIISAILLGFGRVVGETMVVLLCAGNRIAIPDFSHGLGAFFQPVHTMTGIIAQEMGEVPNGSIHYRALFMVGIMLFLISLGINYVAQQIVRRYRISIG